MMLMPAKATATSITSQWEGRMPSTAHSHRMATLMTPLSMRRTRDRMPHHAASTATRMQPGSLPQAQVTRSIHSA